jgi:hypothetical protein
MGEHSFYTLAVYSFAVFGVIKVMSFIVRGSMDEGMSILRKGREHYLELKSWKTNDEVRALSKAEPKT